jgi:hypothetical protein
LHIAETEIVDLESIIGAVRFAHERINAGELWWRGQANADWSLIPRVFTTDGGDEYERNAILRFIQRAPVRHPNTPATDAQLDWLLLMQHYGVPTRLLDWTLSPLIACYFSTLEEGLSGDGALYALNPHLLNLDQISEEIVLSSANSRTKEAVGKAFLFTDDDVDYIAAWLPNEFDIRSMVQQSAFTVHPRDVQLDKIPESEDWLIKFLIPRSSKQSIRRELGALGIQESSLFPDLQHLAHEIKGFRF